MIRTRNTMLKLALALVLSLCAMPTMAYDPCQRASEQYYSAYIDYIVAVSRCQAKAGCNPDTNPGVQAAYRAYASAYRRMQDACS